MSTGKDQLGLQNQDGSMLQKPFTSIVINRYKVPLLTKLTGVNDHMADILTTVMGYTGFRTVNSNTWLTFSSVL
jgi:hypothetical protein